MKGFSYYADFLLVPLYIVAATALGLSWGAPIAAPDVVGYFALAYFAWTFSEYVLHRWILHELFRREHWMHHIRPNSTRPQDNATPKVTAPIIAILWLLFVSIFGMSYGTVIFDGYMSGFFVYMYMHYAIHHSTSRDPRLVYMQACHAIHHAGVECNFGIHVMTWDRLFGTYVPPGTVIPIGSRKKF